MHTAEYLLGKVDAMRLAFPHPVQRRSARPVDPWQSEHANIGPKALPCLIRIGPRGTSSNPDGDLESQQDRIPAGRKGDPRELAATVVFLASDAGGYVTGQTLHINGGMAMI